MKSSIANHVQNLRALWLVAVVPSGRKGRIYLGRNARFFGSRVERTKLA